MAVRKLFLFPHVCSEGEGGARGPLHQVSSGDSLLMTDNFTIIEGGNHTTSPSRNKLIILRDGVYLELFNWTASDSVLNDPAQLPSMNKVWGPKKPGLIDVALTSQPNGEDQATRIGQLNSVLSKADGDGGLGVSYSPPIPGGRKTAQGIDISWELSRAVLTTGPKTLGPEFYPDGRLDIPFWCHDVTDRKLRVPVDDVDKTNHACGAIGVKRVEIFVPETRLEEYATLWTNVAGSEKERLGNGENGWKIATLAPVKGIKAPEIWVKVPKDDKEEKVLEVRGVGIAKIVLSVEAGGQNEVHLADDGIGRWVDVEGK